MGRPTKLPEVGPVLIEAVQRGNYFETAARLAGISERTLYNWIERGEAGDDGFAEFLHALKKAEAEAEDAALQVVKSMPQGWQANAWWLERRFPSRYGRRDPEHALKKRGLELEVEKLTAEIAALKGGGDTGMSADDAKVAEVMREKFGGEPQTFDDDKGE